MSSTSASPWTGWPRTWAWCKKKPAPMGASTPLTELVRGYLKATQDAGENRMDATAIVRRYRD